MKIEIDKDGRRIYKYSSSSAKGGNLYAHKLVCGKIENKEGLRNALNGFSSKYKLIDTTIKIYDEIFFLFFHLPKSLAPAELFDSILKNIGIFGNWHEDYLFTGVYDLQEKFIRKDLERWEYDYDKG